MPPSGPAHSVRRMTDDRLRRAHSGGSLLVPVGAISVITGILALAEPVDRGPRLLMALADAVFGILLLALPKLSLGTVAVLCGLAFIIRGVFAVWTGLRLRGAAPGVSVSAPATHPA